MTVFVSRHRMTECPGCNAHIRVAANLAETTCPFCDAVLGQALARSDSKPSKLGFLGRTGLVAGALLGMSMMAGCEEESEPTPVYGAPPTDVIADQAADNTVQPLYGLATDIQVETAPDLGPQPEYGMPADGQ